VKEVDVPPTIAKELMLEFMVMNKNVRQHKLPEGNFKPWEIMTLMGLDNHHTLRMKDISTMVGLAPSTITQMMDSLVERGYIERVASDVDRRSVNLVLTAEGSAIAHALKREAERVFERITEEIGEAETTQLLTLIKKVNTILGTPVDPCLVNPKENA
jgi:DNA-binding MarR family transcriptional regulator